MEKKVFNIAAVFNTADCICPQCKQPVTEPVTFDTDEPIWVMNWTCKNCGKDIVWFEPKEEKQNAN